LHGIHRSYNLGFPQQHHKILQMTVDHILVHRLIWDIHCIDQTHLHTLFISNGEFFRIQQTGEPQTLQEIAYRTGDLSEIALGFCTFAGDTLSHYNVNASIPKTVMKELVKLLAKRYGGRLGEALADVAATEISPELKEAQKTEDILGPYLLHDFILYYFSKHRMERDDIYQYMMATFDEYDEEVIVRTLDTFFRRFSIARFKRNSMGESAQLTGLKLPYIPTDVKL